MIKSQSFVFLSKTYLSFTLNPVIPSSENAYTNFVQSVFQYTQASVSDPNDITEEDAKRTSEEYIRAYGKVWIDPNTLRKR